MKFKPLHAVISAFALALVLFVPKFVNAAELPAIPSVPSGYSTYLVSVSYFSDLGTVPAVYYFKDGSNPYFAGEYGSNMLHNSSEFYVYYLNNGVWNSLGTKTTQSMGPTTQTVTVSKGTISLRSGSTTGDFVFTGPQPVSKLANLGNLTTAFGGQLKVILPIGVIILATLLGVSLIPRLVHSFL